MAIFLTTFKLGIYLTTLTALVERSQGLRCIQCFKAPHFAHCEDTVTCNATQICYVEQRVVYGQTLVFAGCKERTECDNEGCFGEKIAVVANRWSQGRELKCHHCCDSNFCNMYGCPDTFDVSHLSGSRCFNCDQIQRPEICENITNCGSQQVCMMEKFATGYEIFYRLGCERKSMCTELAKVKEELRNSTTRRKRQAVRFFSQCCTPHLCNRQDPIYDAPPSPLSLNYNCPSPPPLTTSTTQSTTRKTTPTTMPTSIRTTATRTTTTEPSKDVPIHGSHCHDKTICALYSKETACSLPWRDWARETCPKMCNLCSGTALKRMDSSTTQLSLNSVPDCRDQIDCTVFGKDYACRGEFVPWAKINCPVYCGLCPGTTTTSTTTAAVMQKGIFCEDKIDCTIYGKEYACDEEFKTWATSNCPRYCGLCSEALKLRPTTDESSTSTIATLPISTTVGSFCEDRTDCSVYGKDYACAEEFQEWATTNCPQFCGLCGEASRMRPVTDESSRSTTATFSISSTEGTICMDRTDCSVYGKDYVCTEEFREWATTNCPRFCGLCGGSSSSPASGTNVNGPGTESKDCKDKIDCSIYGKDYACNDEFKEWASENCPKFCGRCNEIPMTTASVLMTATTELPTSSASATKPSSNCSDKIDCAVYSYDYICTDEFRSWATDNCPATCGYC